MIMKNHKNYGIMKKINLGFTILVLIVFCHACNGPAGKEKRVIADLIEYPVFIKNPYGEENGEYWKENLETSKRLDFVKTLFDWAYTGKVKTFDYLTNQPLNIEQVKSIGNESDTFHINKSVPPYDEMDTVIQKKLDFNLIHKLKFLEKWSFDEDNFLLEKKLIGIAPALTVFADSATIKGYKPLFWIYFDKEYIKKITEKK
jgi:hypothetical protein